MDVVIDPVSDIPGSQLSDLSVGAICGAIYRIHAILGTCIFVFYFTILLKNPPSVRKNIRYTYYHYLNFLTSLAEAPLGL